MISKNLDRLIVECLENGCIWGLRDAEEQWATVDSDEVSEGCYAFWSSQALIGPLCKEYVDLCASM